MYPLPFPLQLRPVRDDDQAFLDALYDSTRADLKQMNTDPQFVAQLIKMQQQMQAHGFRSAYPEAQYLLLERHGERLGRLVLEYDARSLRVIDLALLPAAQGQGVGMAVLSALQAWVAERRLPLLLNVSKANQRAIRLCRALGFQAGRADEAQQEMRWSGEPLAQAPQRRERA